MFGLLINLFLVTKTIKALKINKYRKILLKSDSISAKSINNYCYSLFFYYNLLSIPTALSHEAIIFLALPLNINNYFKFTQCNTV